MFFKLLFDFLSEHWNEFELPNGKLKDWASALYAWSFGGGGLEPLFGVLFSAIFHSVSLENFHRVETGGKERKQNCSFL